MDGKQTFAMARLCDGQLLGVEATNSARDWRAFCLDKMFAANRVSSLGDNDDLNGRTETSLPVSMRNLRRVNLSVMNKRFDEGSTATGATELTDFSFPGLGSASSIQERIALLDHRIWHGTCRREVVLGRLSSGEDCVVC